MVGKTKAPNKAEKRRMTILKEHVPCIPCLLLAKIRLPSIQHTVSGMTRDGHMSTYSLCDWHHFGHPLAMGADDTRYMLGPSFAHGRKPFERYFGPESELVAIATGLVDSFESNPWLDYDVPHRLRGDALRREGF